jgi:light-regulated signal transduction histidine kinase (bacteriophytochrome)
MSTFNVAPTIKSSIRILSEHNKDKANIKLNINNDVSNLIVYGDSLRLKQIFLNIIENIIDHSPNPKTNIEISLNLMKSNEDSSEIKLISNISCDANLPLQEEDIADSKSHQFKYAGSEKDIIEEIPLCDLTIAKKILELNNGSLSIESGSGYTSFSFIISFEKPNLDKEQNVALKSKDSNLIKSSKKINISDANLLLVEDNLINQKIVILSLK